MIQVQLYGFTYLIHTGNSQLLVPNKDEKLIYHTTNYWKSEENPNYVLIDIRKNFSKPCTERLEKSGLATPICKESNKSVSFKSNLEYFYLHLGQCRIYNV